MGMSYPVGMHEPLERLMNAQHEHHVEIRATHPEAGDFPDGLIFVEQPRNKDYGKSMNLPAYRVSNGVSVKLGYVRIRDNGGLSMPPAVSRVLDSYMKGS